jgi:hypothetical protein
MFVLGLEELHGCLDTFKTWFGKIRGLLRLAIDCHDFGSSKPLELSSQEIELIVGFRSRQGDHQSPSIEFVAGLDPFADSALSQSSHSAWTSFIGGGQNKNEGCPNARRALQIFAWAA